MGCLVVVREGGHGLSCGGEGRWSWVILVSYFLAWEKHLKY